MSIAATSLRCCSLYPIFIWILTAVSTTPPPTNPELWEKGPMEDIAFTHLQSLLPEGLSTDPVESVITAHSRQPWPTPDSCYSGLSGPEPAGSPPSRTLPSYPITTPTVLQEVPLEAQSGRRKRKYNQVQISPAQSASYPSPASDEEWPPTPETGQTGPHQGQSSWMQSSACRAESHSEIDRTCLSVAELPGIKPSSERRKYGVESNNVDHLSILHFSPKGLIYLAFLKDAYERFKVKLASSEHSVTNLRIKCRPPGVLLTVYQSPKELDPKKVIRVMRSLTGKNQSIPSWISLYKSLIGWMYEHHEEILNRSNLPTYVYRSQQEKLVSWLEEQIFAPSSSLPIMGRINVPGDFRWEDHALGAIQAELIKYFSQESDNNLLARPTSLSLVEKFYAQHQDDYIASNYPSEISIHRISEGPEFQILRSFLVDSIHQQRFALAEQLRTNTNDPFLLSTFKFVKVHLEENSISFFQLKSLHPKLPTAMYFADINSNRQLFRVLYREDRAVVRSEDLLSMFRMLSKAMDFFHRKVLELLETNLSEFETRKDDLFEWLVQSIIEPVGSLCVFGKAKINGNLAPWEDINNGALNLYGEVQLELIEYFSDKYPSPNLEYSATVLILLWYKYYHPDDFEYLTHIAENSD
ncbi:hypothetical protein PGT21_010660 [Puccinia graminis f. sp. tritici]|uniref:Uncharacterized protein n=1 Tax=Puccinia graminis f. sp. tritici TaxID=56615 RepID=A0A5B0QF24_PUCGR|nr:hypothetical protein PGT21_010660 [Puccinia graminis f. sp. tritici]